MSDRKEMHRQRFTEPTFEAIRNLPREVLAMTIAKAYTNALTKHAGIHVGEFTDAVDTLIERADDRPDTLDPDTLDLFEQ